MSEIFDAALLGSTFRFVAPILLAALGGLLCARAGVFNIALEGLMLIPVSPVAFFYGKALASTAVLFLLAPVLTPVALPNSTWTMPSPRQSPIGGSRSGGDQGR